MNKELIFKGLNWIFVLAVLGLAFSISFFPNYSLGFLVLLGGVLLSAFFISKTSSISVLTVIRILVGLLFVYSGFVKGVDPLGTQYRIEDYFYAFNMPWATDWALILSVLLNAFEFSLGLFLILNLRMKLVAWLSILVMIFFTVTTLNDALFSPVPDCGCFGDALIISNWQTFYKNLIIFAFVLVIFLRKNDFHNAKSIGFQFSAMALVFLIFSSFEIYTIRHLPFLDFRPWKIGNRLIPENPQPAKYFLTYSNSKTGEEQEYLSTELPWQDSIFKADWKYVSTREVNPDAQFYRTFPMMDEDGNDLSNSLAASAQPVFLMVLHDISIASPEALQSFAAIYAMCQDNGWEFYLLNSNVPSDFEKFSSIYSLPNFPILNSDDTSLKAAIRANPGLIIIQNGVVLHKFNHRDIPSVDVLKSKFQD